MTRWLLLIVALGIATISDHSIAAEISKDQIETLWQSSCNPWVDYNCAAPKVSPRALKARERSGNCDPYLDYKCLDAPLGNDFFTRFYRYYALEWGHAVAPSDPNVPPSRRSDSVWPPTPQSTPPMPFTEWPYGGTTTIGKFGRQSAHGRPVKHTSRCGDERLARASLWLGRSRRQRQHQYDQAGWQCSGGIRLHAQHGPA